MRNTRNWKHATKQEKQYGKREMEKYETPFMMLDEEYLEDDEEEVPK